MVFSMETPSVDNKIGCIKRWLGAYCQGEKAGGPWSEEERKLQISVLELKGPQPAILYFTQNTKHLNNIDIQMDNMVALSYLMKTGRRTIRF